MIARSRIAVILVWKEKRESLILARENKTPEARERGEGEKPSKISQLDLAGTGCLCFSFCACLPEQEAGHPSPRHCSVPSEVSCVSPLKGSSPHRWGETAFCAFPGMFEQIAFFRVVSFCPELQRTALQGYSNSGLSRRNHVYLMT